MNKVDLTSGSLLKHIVRMAIPGMGGFFAIVVFNFTDTYFVSKLGTNALAAMGYTFPIVMIMHALVLGVSAGAEVIVSHSLGAKNKSQAREITAAGIYLALILSAIASGLGVLFLDDVFGLLSAKGEALRLAEEYMFIWFLTATTVFMPPVSDGLLRASGDMVRPFVVMTICAVFNAGLDPLLIFGYWGFPELGIAGAAYATAIARSIAMLISLYFLTKNAKLMQWKYIVPKKLVKGWLSILKLGMPASVTQLMFPLSRFVFTKLIMIASGGVGVAAIAAGSRIEYFTQIVPYAISFALVAIFGQNLGAKKFDRLQHGFNLLAIISFAYGVLALWLFLLGGHLLSEIMSDGNAAVEYLTYKYLIYTAIGCGGFYFTMLSLRAIIALGKSLDAAILNIIQVLLIVLPSVVSGFYIAGFDGLVVGSSIGNLISGLLLIVISKKLVRGLRKKDEEGNCEIKAKIN